MERFLEYLANHPFLAGAAVLLALLVIANEARLRMLGSNALRPSEAVTLINRGGIVLDVRDHDSYAGGHIVNATNVPFSELQDKLGSLEKQRRKAIVICCDGGLASARAATMLRKQGFEQVYALQGGLAAWRRENLPVVVGASGKS